MEKILEQKLAWIKNYKTRYEVEMVATDGRKWLVQYTSQKSRTGLLAAIRKVGESILAVGGASLPDHFKLTTCQAVEFGNGWIIRFSGRTQREAYLGGELPFVVHAAKS